MTTPSPVAELTPTKRALYEIRQLRARVEELERERHEPIAIIGMGLRFPGNASTPDEFWQVLTSGADTAAEIPPRAGRSKNTTIPTATRRER